ncbi:MAG: O-antigen ligase family protein, partial [Planctomycetales bacterium]|nr:O-antigen ligase family protein [Planctomycetales bacterium]
MSGWIVDGPPRANRKPFDPSQLGRQVTDVALAGLLFAAPCFFGGRHDTGRFIFAACAVVAACASMFELSLVSRKPWVRSAAHWIFLVAAAWAALQLAPLPAPWLSRLSPRLDRLLPLWSADAHMPWGTWRQLSTSPPQTRQALAMLIAYGCLFTALLQRMRSLQDVTRLVHGVGLASGVMAAFGLLQYAVGNGKFFWFYEHPSRSTDLDVMGAFANRNHFAHFVALGLAPLAGWLLLQISVDASHARGKRRRSQAHSPLNRQVALTGLLAILLITAGFAVLRSCSRGGALAAAVAMGVSASIFAWKGLLRGPRAAGFTATALAALALASTFGYERIVNRLDTLVGTSLEQLDETGGRRKIWSANWAAIQDGGIAGAGAGSHTSIYPVYMEQPPNLEYTHAESGYLQLLTELGWFAAPLVLAALALCAIWAWKAIALATTPARVAVTGACVGGVAASIFHATFDFVWYVPACMSVALTMAACLARLARLPGDAPASLPAESERPTTREAVHGRAMLVACSGFWALSTLLGPALAAPHIDRYLVLSRAYRRLESAPLTKRETEDPTLRLKSQVAALQGMISKLEAACAKSPSEARCRLQLASRYCQLFELLQQTSENSMPLVQIRDAALAADFPDGQALHAWLKTAFGDRPNLLYRAFFHAYAAATLSPLEGEVYLRLAETEFATHGMRTPVEAYVQQAVAVRPYDGDVLFGAGKEALLGGRFENAFAYWKQAFANHGPHQDLILMTVCQHLPASLFVEEFQPGWDTLPTAWGYYAQANSPDQLETLLDYAVSRAETDSESLDAVRMAGIWREVGRMQQQTKVPESA